MGIDFGVVKMEVGLGTLLMWAWLAATCPIIVAMVLSSRLNWFHRLVLGFAMRGKTMQPSSPSDRFTVPQKFFLHFYLLAVVWTTILLVTTGFYAHEVAPFICNPSQYSTILSHLIGGSNAFSLRRSRSSKERDRYRAWQSVFLLLLMEVQVLRRLYETLYVFKYSPSARMHLFGYLAGIFFYTAAPLSLCSRFAPDVFTLVAEEVTEFIVRGKDHMMSQIRGSDLDWCVFVSALVRLNWYSWLGTAIFFYGWVHQLRCHSILGSMRGNPAQARDYVIPHGDWFEYVSSPHYLAEIVIYAGFVVASGSTDLTIWLLFGFVVANLVIAAAETHNWYLQKFENYPRCRFAIFPKVY